MLLRALDIMLRAASVSLSGDARTNRPAGDRGTRAPTRGRPKRKAARGAPSA
jgi:hypothetical protein